MKKKKEKQVVLFDNYDDSNYEDDVKEYLLEKYDESEITDTMIYNCISNWKDDDWHMLIAELNHFFAGETLILCGSVGSWRGNLAGGLTGTDFSKILFDFGEDCGHFKIYEENNHFYIECSHHDGTNFAELKVLTNKGAELLDYWENSIIKSREEIHNTLFNCNFYSKLPHYTESLKRSIK